MSWRDFPGRGRSTTAGREESEPWTFLERVPEPPTLRIAELLQVAIELIHGRQPATDRSRVPKTTGNFS